MKKDLIIIKHQQFIEQKVWKLYIQGTCTTNQNWPAKLVERLEENCEKKGHFTLQTTSWASRF